MRNAGLRREKILQLLVDHGSLQVAELSEQCKVSLVTIRADLAALEHHGKLTRMHGGAELNRMRSPEQSIYEKCQINMAAKERIGSYAAQLVKPGDKIIIDSGTTTAMLARNLRNLTDISVMTNGLNVANALVDAQGVELLLTGGRLHKESLSLHGPQAEACLDHYIFDKLFFGVDGCDLQFGITTHYEKEASLNRKMVDRVRQVIVLADSSKFGKVALNHIVRLERVNTIITDSELTKPYQEYMQQLGIEVIVVG
jgi:DeoR family transcriptional regulator of aga operon